VGAPLLLFSVTFAVYLNSIHNEFLFDDLETIVQRQRPGGSGLTSELFRLLRGKPTYRPLRSASYAFDHALSGLEPWGYHLTNIGYHAVSAVLVFVSARTLFDHWRPALIAALLFAVHPIQTDAVTYLSGRRDVLAGLFVLAGFTAFLRYRQSARKGYAALILLFYLAAFFSKESGVVLPLLCFTYDVIARIRPHGASGGLRLLREVWSGSRAAFRQGLLLYLPFALLAGGLAAYVLFLVRGTWLRTYHGGSLWFTLLTEARVVVHYLKLLIFPLTLNADYSYNAFPVTVSWTDPNAMVAVSLLAALGYGLVRCLATRPLAAFGGLWFCIALLPVLQIVPHHEMMAEHYLYIPSVGFFLLVAALVNPLLDHPRLAPLSVGAGLLILFLLSLRTIRRNADWRDELTLWSTTVRTAPQSVRARNNLGAAYLRRGRLSQAQEQVEAALRIDPEFAFAHANLGKIHLDRGEWGRAEREFLTAIRLKGNEAIPHLWLGAAYVQQGQLDKAERQFRLVLSMPLFAAYAYNNLGALYARAGRVAEAGSAFNEALQRMPDLVEARENLDRLGRLKGAAWPEAARTPQEKP